MTVGREQERTGQNGTGARRRAARPRANRTRRGPAQEPAGPDERAGDGDGGRDAARARRAGRALPAHRRAARKSPVEGPGAPVSRRRPPTNRTKPLA